MLETAWPMEYLLRSPCDASLIGTTCFFQTQHMTAKSLGNTCLSFANAFFIIIVKELLEFRSSQIRIKTPTFNVQIQILVDSASFSLSLKCCKCLSGTSPFSAGHMDTHPILRCNCIFCFLQNIGSLL